MMKLQRQRWLFAGIAGLGLPFANEALGQASGQGGPPGQASGQAGVLPQTQLPGATAIYPRGGGPFPQGRQSLGSLGAGASPQFGTMATPYGAINMGTPGALPASPGTFVAP